MGEVWTHLSLFVPPVKRFSFDLSSFSLVFTTNLFISHKLQKSYVEDMWSSKVIREFLCDSDA